MNSNSFKEEDSIVYFSEIVMIYCLSFLLDVKCAGTLIKTTNKNCDLKPKTEKFSFFITTVNKGKSWKFKVAECFLTHLMLT